MRNLSEKLKSDLQSGATTFCRCWLISRRDGVQFGFTDHDKDLSFDGIVFAAMSGLNASVIESSLGLSVDNALAVGALSSENIRESDILGGAFDRSEVHHWKVNWQDPASRILLFRGTLGEIKRADGVFEAELRGVTETLNSPVGRSYLRTCDRVLGDAKCGVNLDDPVFSIHAELVEIDSKRRVEFLGLEGYADAWFEAGFVRWANGQTSLIKTDSYSGGSRILELWEEVRFSVQAGEVAKIVAGCNKTVKTCRAKFNNFNNFRGFPHIPGDDFVTSYPTSDGQNDGQSLRLYSEVGDA